MKEGLGLKPRREGRKFTLRGLAGLAGSRQNRYISANLWFSYDSVLRVGPFRTRSFLLPERARRRGPLGQPSRTAMMVRSQPKLDRF